jgi:hypothetical protein
LRIDHLSHKQQNGDICVKNGDIHQRVDAAPWFVPDSPWFERKTMYLKTASQARSWSLFKI